VYQIKSYKYLTIIITKIGDKRRTQPILVQSPSPDQLARNKFVTAPAKAATDRDSLTLHGNKFYARIPLTKTALLCPPPGMTKFRVLPEPLVRFPSP
jgi:hypothetical protein